MIFLFSSNNTKGWVREEDSGDGERLVKIQLQDATTSTKVRWTQFNRKHISKFYRKLSSSLVSYLAYLSFHLKKKYDAWKKLEIPIVKNTTKQLSPHFLLEKDKYLFEIILFYSYLDVYIFKSQDICSAIFLLAITPIISIQ